MLSKVVVAARPASSSQPTGDQDRVGLVVGVPLWAMCLASVVGRRTVSSSDVFFVRNCFEMAGIHAVSDSAEVIDYKVRRNRTDEPLVNHSMNWLVSTNSDRAVMVAIQGSLPQPALRLNVADHELPKPEPQHPVIQIGRQPFAQNLPEGRYLREEVGADVHRLKRIINHQEVV